MEGDEGDVVDLERKKEGKREREKEGRKRKDGLALAGYGH